MRLYECMLIYNDCYKANKKHIPKGVMVHDTSAGNPNIGRYVQPKAPQPADNSLTPNKYDNDWNRSGFDKCTHAMIGKLADGSIATYQTLPFDIAGWHSGSGSKGKAQNANNTGYIGFEICDDGYTNRNYFEKVYREAVEFTAYICKTYNIEVNNKTVIAHYEGHNLGIASDHSDVKVWFSKFGKTMDDFRSDVKAELEPPKPEQEYKVGDFVHFLGGPQYNNPSTDRIDQNVKESDAVITNISKGSKHPYHLRKADDKGNIIGGIPYGYVDEGTFRLKEKPEKKKFKVGDVVEFLGGPQYNNYITDRVDQHVKESRAVITNIKEGSKHPYHLRKADKDGKIIGGLPYGWVDAENIDKE